MVGDTLAHVVDVVLRLPEQCGHVVIVQSVGDGVSAALRPNEMVLSQKISLTLLEKAG